jgi:hypothetical protein
MAISYSNYYWTPRQPRMDFSYSVKLYKTCIAPLAEIFQPFMAEKLDTKVVCILMNE